MLQQTVISAVIPYYKRWMERYPDIHRLACSSGQKVLRLWEGLGYYSRAQNIIRTAKLLVRENEGRIPDQYEKLILLPGIGDYTASAILSIAYGKPYPVMDANVKRVTQRIYGIRNLSRQKEKKVKTALQALMPRKDPGMFNEALMELGQKTCLPSRPLCGECPVRTFCLSYRNSLTDAIPRKKSRGTIRKETWLPVMLSGQRLLITKKAEGVLKHLWLLPQTRKREEMAPFIRKNITEKFRKIGRLPPFVHRYTKYTDILHPVLFRAEERIKKIPDSMRWADLREISRYPFPSVYRKILGEIRKNSRITVDHGS